MAFPGPPSNVTNTPATAIGTAHTLSVPSGMTDGNLCVIGFAGGQSGVTFTNLATAMGGWTPLITENTLFATTTPQGVACVYARKVASGSWTPGDLSLETNNTTRVTAVAFEIADWSGGDPPAVNVDFNSSVTDTNASTTQACPTITADWGSDDNLFIIFGFFDNSTVSVAGGGGNYTEIGTQNSAGSTSPTTSAYYRQLASNTDSPAAWTISASQDGLVVGLVIRPASGGTSVAPYLAQYTNSIVKGY